MALESQSQSEFRKAWLNRLALTLKSDAATISSSSDGRAYAIQSLNSPCVALERMPAWIDQFEPHELSLLMNRATCDEELWPGNRRDQLLVCHEYIRLPGSTVQHGMRGWVSRGTVFFVFVGRCRGAKEFEAEELQALENLIPLIALGEVLHVQEHARAKHPVEDLVALSSSESKVAALAQRGLTNPEISLITGTAMKTVRNQLSSVYRKLGVTNRTELTFLLSGLDTDILAGSPPPRTPVQKLLGDTQADPTENE
jgi:DNA-binding CsgD family transcriptional regulator